MQHYSDNKDMTAEQIKDLREAFDMIDTDCSGTITTDELDVVMSSLGQKTSKSEIKKMIAEADADGDGEIDFGEFLNLMKTRRVDPEDELREIFNVFDQDGDQKISSLELKAVMANLGEFLNDKMLTEMMKEADLDGDGSIDFHEFVELVKNIESNPESPPNYTRTR